MILSKLAAATLVVGVAGSVGETPTHQLSLQQRDAATRAYVRSATDCIARTVVSDTRFRKDNPASNLGDLIVNSVPKCLDPVRAMIAAHDRYFGEGSGEDFFVRSVSGRASGRSGAPDEEHHHGMIARALPRPPFFECYSKRFFPRKTKLHRSSPMQ